MQCTYLSTWQHDKTWKGYEYICKTMYVTRWAELYLNSCFSVMFFYVIGESYVCVCVCVCVCVRACVRVCVCVCEGSLLEPLTFFKPFLEPNLQSFYQSFKYIYIYTYFNNCTQNRFFFYITVKISFGTLIFKIEGWLTVTAFPSFLCEPPYGVI